jgi:hypothetical protein
LLASVQPPRPAGFLVQELKANAEQSAITVSTAERELCTVLIFNFLLSAVAFEA